MIDLTESNVFVPTPTVTEFGHARSFEDTHTWLKSLLRRVPITRLTNTTPLDFIGLPVWSAVTPLAKDLTVHSGKGHTDMASRISAIMEAIERVCAEEASLTRIRRASYAELTNSTDVDVVDPRAFDLPFATSYHRNRIISWVSAYDLLQRKPTWVALDLAISPPQEGVCLGVETNGLGAGNTYTEAIIHALYEVIERDASSEDRFSQMYFEPTDFWAKSPLMIDTTTMPSDSQVWVNELENQGLNVYVQCLTNEIQVPVFKALIVDSRFPGVEGNVGFEGYGADLNSTRALFRALTEAVQSHAVVMLGARDTYEGTPIPHRQATLRRRLDFFYPRSYITFPRGTEAPSGDLLVDLKIILTRLADAGIRHCLVVNLTREDLQVPVIRVLVPGLTPPYGDSTRRPGLRLLRRLV